ncbi:MAG: FG-GAP-like repeat-containing protein, partial [Bacteroidota bacterium]
WVDYDNDYDKDLLVTCYQASNRLYRNDGNLSFTDVSDFAGIPNKNDPTFGASFGDYDRDGDLDLYVCNYTFGLVHTSYFLANNGNGTFTNVTQTVGLTTPPNFSFQSMFFDHNNDLWPDIYVAVDMDYNNLLFHNDGLDSPGGIIAFTDMTYSSGAGVIVDAMNSGAGDYDNDGDLDIYVSNTAPAPGNILLRNEGNMTYSSVGAACQVDFFVTSWAANFFDFNNDSYLDLYVSTLAPGNTNNGLFINNGTCPFTLYDGNFSGNALASFSNAYGDYNQDGQLDLAISQVSPNNYLLLKNTNPAGSTGKWLKVKLEGVSSNTDGIGSWIEVYKDGQKYVRFTHCGEGFMTQNSSTTHFGLGNYNTVDSLIVRWPSGVIDKAVNLSTNQCVYVLENTFIPLPVSLQQFEAKRQDNRYAMLHWQTASESNSSHFEIERSPDGRNFTFIAQVDARGNSSSLQNYQYQDEPGKTQEQYYYRLKLVDQDRSFQYSPVRQVHFDTEVPFQVKAIHPNPVKDDLCQLDLFSDQRQEVQLKIYNNVGQLMRQQTQQINTGHQLIDLSTTKLANGLYLITIEQGTNHHFQKLMVAR